jgi:3-hydroxyacyl-[acyl-carrier-protein] dehydratase
MRFTLIDRIDELVPGERVSAVKTLSMAEEYLADHFPRFAVMPGVLMLEAMTQAAAWLVRVSEDFAHTIVVLKEARNVKYAEFVEPGQVLHVKCEISKQDERLTHLKASGMVVNGTKAVTAQLVLERFNVVDRYPGRAEIDLYTRRKLREQLRLLYPSAADEVTI